MRAYFPLALGFAISTQLFVSAFTQGVVDTTSKAPARSKAIMIPGTECSPDTKATGSGSHVLSQGTKLTLEVESDSLMASLQVLYVAKILNEVTTENGQVVKPGASLRFMSRSEKQGTRYTFGASPHLSRDSFAASFDAKDNVVPVQRGKSIILARLQGENVLESFELRKGDIFTVRVDNPCSLPSQK